MPIKDDLTPNPDETLRDIIEYVKSEDRIHPKDWCAIMNLKNNEGTPLSKINGFPTSLILGGTGCNNAEKRRRLIEQIRFAANHGALNIVNSYLKSLPNDHWTHGTQDAPGFYDLQLERQELEGEIAEDGLRLCLRLFEIENIELVPDYSDQKTPSGKTSFNELELENFFDALQTLYPISAENLDLLINSALAGAKQLRYLNGWPSTLRIGDELDHSEIKSKEKDEEYWERRLIENEAMIIKFQLLRLYERYRISLRSIFGHVYKDLCDIRSFSELIWDLYIHE
jgi:hypothetical protein